MVPPFSAVWQKHSVVLQRSPDFGRRREYVLEVIGHNADHCVRICIERDLSSNDCRIASKSPPPQAVTDDRDSRTVDLVVGLLKLLSEIRCDPEDPEVACAHSLTLESFRLVCAGHCRLPLLEHSNVVERTTAF